MRMTGSWSAYLAGKAIAISIVAIGAAVALSRMALPRLTAVLGEMGTAPPAWALRALDFRDELPLLPVPGLLLGIAALMFRSFRGLLAVAAIIAAGLATGIIIAMLIGSLMPFYDTGALY